MSTVTKEFREEMEKELAYYDSFTHPVRASILEQLLRLTTPVSNLHPNPEDEFVNPEVGPNLEIINQYVEMFADAQRQQVKPKMDLLYVEKLSKGGYMILNGHHRWYAARKMRIKRIAIKVANIVHESDILSRLKKLRRSKCVSFDLDEVLLCSDGSEPTDTLPAPLQKAYPWPVRKDAGKMISTLQDLGFDVWVYTGNCHDVRYIRRALKAHRCRVDGVMNGLKNGRPSKKVTEAFREKYTTVIHVDTQQILWVNTKTKDYDIIPLEKNGSWAESVTGLVLKTAGEKSKTELMAGV